MNIDDLIALERNKSTCNWISTYGFVGKLARSINARRLCEVGVAYGYHAEHILEDIADIEYQGVDPYKAGYDENDIFVSDVAKMYKCPAQLAMDRLYCAVNIKLTRYGGRANLLRKPSVAAAAQFADQSFDLIYIDGDHTYAGVLADLEAWYGKVKPGGIFCGDDFTWDGVRQAVMEFMAKKGKSVIGHSYPNDPFPSKWSINL